MVADKVVDLTVVESASVTMAVNGGDCMSGDSDCVAALILPVAPGTATTSDSNFPPHPKDGNCHHEFNA